MKWFAVLVIFGLGACGQADDPPSQPQVANLDAVSAPAARSMGAAPAAAMEAISVPKDKAQLDRMLALGYTVHEDHMHPPGVKECALDKAGGSVIQ